MQDLRERYLELLPKLEALDPNSVPDVELMGAIGRLSLNLREVEAEHRAEAIALRRDIKNLVNAEPREGEVDVRDRSRGDREGPPA